jgi:hypothetical protein
MDPVTLSLIVQGVVAATPGILHLFHATTNGNGDTTVVILDRAKKTAAADDALIAQWNATHPSPTPEAKK